MSRVVDVQTVSIAIASAGVLVAAVYYILQIRNQSRMRQMDMLMRIYLTWGSEDMKKSFRNVLALEFKDYDDFLKKYGPTSQAWLDIDKIGWFLNGLGFLVHEKFASIKLVKGLLHARGVMVLWEKMKPVIEGVRKAFDMPESNSWFEYLYNEMKKREQQPTKIG